ncbi:hypothetical protein [Butyrivibrio sp. TB]|uniref:hypothetical protein n=1 Tax=Butyrivibrio sp. TB TaxID=1520809 RepID=UPI0008D2A109|nr:hypothetical protein [Butyrivibrio sp. TB]SEP54882.1 hypothetical protein SAMN02910382_00104 [Butyrivibrio sp. TB]
MAKAKYENIFKDLKEKIESEEYEYQSILPSENILVPESVFAYKRSLEEKAIYVYGNLDNNEVEVSIGEKLSKGSILIQNYNRDIDLKAHSMTLKPYEFVAVIV